MHYFCFVNDLGRMFNILKVCNVVLVSNPIVIKDNKMQYMSYYIVILL